MYIKLNNSIMPKSNLQIRQFQSTNNKTFIFYQYKDDKNNNFEYQVYELVEGAKAARELGAPDNIPNRESKLNTREMCDWIFKNI